MPSGVPAPSGLTTNRHVILRSFMMATASSASAEGVIVCGACVITSAAERGLSCWWICCGVMFVFGLAAAADRVARQWDYI